VAAILSEASAKAAAATMPQRISFPLQLMVAAAVKSHVGTFDASRSGRGTRWEGGRTLGSGSDQTPATSATVSGLDERRPSGPPFFR
jgi:hypothetical protein